MSANNIIKLTMSKGEIIQNAPSKIDLMHQVFEDLSGNKPIALENHGLTEFQPRGILSSVPEDRDLLSEIHSWSMCHLRPIVYCRFSMISVQISRKHWKFMDLRFYHWSGDLIQCQIVCQCCRHLPTLPKSCSTSRWMRCPMTHWRWRIQS